MEYRPRRPGPLTAGPHRAAGPRQVGSLTGAVASQKATEARKGGLRPVGNRPCRVQGRKPA